MNPQDVEIPLAHERHLSLGQDGSGSTGNDVVKQATEPEVSVRRVPDGRWGWVVVVAAYLLQGLSVGVSLSTGVLVSQWMHTFDTEPARVALIASFNTGFMFIAAPLASVLCNRFTHRAVVMTGSLLSALGLVGGAFTTTLPQLYLTYGVLSGLGFSLVANPTVVLVGCYFDRRRPLAMGLTVVGVSVGCLALPPLLQYFLDLLGWRATMLAMAGICLQGLPLGALLFPVEFWTVPPSKQAAHARSRSRGCANVFHASLLKELSFHVFFWNNLLWNCGCGIYHVLLIDFAVVSGVEGQLAALTFALVGLSGMCGRAFTAITLGVRPDVNRLHYYNVMTFLTGLAVAIPLTSQNKVTFMLSALTFGLFYGGMIGSLGTLSADMFGVKRLTSSFGYLMLANGLGSIAGSPLGGRMRSAFGSYQPAFLFGSLCFVLSSILMWPLCVRRPRDGGCGGCLGGGCGGRRGGSRTSHRQDIVEETIVTA